MTSVDRAPSNGASGWLASAASRLLTDERAYSTLVRALGASQSARELIEEVSGAAWHLTALPSRRDAHRLLRRTATLNRKMVELERAVRRLELLVEARATGERKTG